MGMQIVTPEKAAEWIAISESNMNHNNRRVKQDNVRKLCKEISEGRWKPEVNLGIFITADGFVMNGQHTLHAIAESGVAVPINVYLNSDISLMNSFDNGIARSVNDVFAMNNVTNVAIKTSASKILHAYQNNKTGMLSKSPLTHEQALHFYKENEAMDDFIYKAQSLNKEPGIKPAIALAFLYEADPTNSYPDVSNEWFQGLNKAVGCVENDPRTALASKIRMKKIKKLKRVAREEVIEYIKCWNAWVSDAQIKVLTVGKVEGMPKILPASNKVLTQL